MDRKNFIAAFGTAGVALTTFNSWASSNIEAGFRKHKIPPYLKPGDTIGITSPASYISLAEVQPAVQLMESWGFKVIVGNTVGKKDFTYGGTDEECTTDFQQMLDNPAISAIMCARGGYGFVRIIDRLDFKQFASQPKWLIGFSDITVLHCHVNRHLHVATLHSKMCNSFPADRASADAVQLATIDSIKLALTGEPLKYTSPQSAYNRAGNTTGELVGGNLSMIVTLSGTASELDTDNKILFIEDTDEYLYSIDRMFWNLKRTGRLAKLAGLIIGGFKLKPDTPGEEFGKSIYEIVLEKVKEYNYPVCFDFPVGHQRNNVALKCGVQHLLQVGDQGAVLSAMH